MSIIISFGKPIWKVRVEYTGRAFRFAALFVSVMVLDYDFDEFLGTVARIRGEKP